MSDQVRKGITQARFNAENRDIIIYEILGFIMSVILSLLWAILAYFIGLALFSLSAGIVLAIIVFLASMGGHLSSMEYYRDL